MESYQKNVLLALIDSGKESIATLSEMTGYSVPTVTKNIKLMHEKGLVISHESDLSARGRRPLLYSANPDAYYFMGVDIRRFELSFGIMNLVGEIIYQECRGDFLFENTHECLDTICKCLDEFLNKHSFPKEKIDMVNINLSGRVDTNRGYCHSIFNFEGNDLPLSELIAQTIGIKTIISNDTQAMTYGELIFGAGKEFSNFLFVNAGWGIGLGIVIDGKVYTGTNGYAGEIGHMNIYDNEYMCHCGKKGCLETEISGQAILRILRNKVNQGAVSILSEKIRSGNAVTTTDIVRAANHEDPLSLDVIEKVGAELGRQIANLINILNPEAVIIGGNLSLANEYLLEPIRQGVRKYSLKLINKDLVILRTLHPDKIGVIGACAVARERLLRN